MAAKKKNKKKAKRKAARKKAAPRKKPAKKMSMPKRKPSGKKAARRKKRIRGKSESVDSVVFEPKGLGARSGGQSGDLQGLSGTGRRGFREWWESCWRKETPFEAEVVKGVQDAGDADEGEVKPTK